MRGEVRLPLQTGSAFAVDVAWAAVFLGLAAMVPFTFAAAHGALGLAARGGAWLTILGWLAIGAALVLAAGRIAAARRRRPSDLSIREQGIVVRGGPFDGLDLRWEEVDVGAWSLARSGDATQLQAGHDMVLAEATTDDEKRALAATLETVRESCRFALEGRTPHDAVVPTGVLACGACGNIVSPDDAESVRCDHCGRAVAVPDELRRRVQIAASLRDDMRSLGREIRSIVDQPSATWAASAIAATAAPMIAIWPLAVRYALIQQRRLLDVLLLLAVALAVVAAAHVAARVLVARRQSLSLVALSLSAVAPIRPGAPARCRACGGALPARPADVLAVCPWCNVENVLGFDVHREVRARAFQEQEVASALRHLRLRNVALAAVVCAIPPALLLAARAVRELRDENPAAAGPSVPSPGEAFDTTTVRTFRARVPASIVPAMHLVETVVPRVEIRGGGSLQKELFSVAFTCHAGAAPDAVLHLTFAEQAPNAPYGARRIDVRSDPPIAALTACISRELAARPIGNGIARPFDVELQVAGEKVLLPRPPSLLALRSLVESKLDATLVRVRDITVVRNELRTDGKGLYRVVDVGGEVEFLTAGFIVQCLTSFQNEPRYERAPEEGCTNRKHAAGDRGGISKTLFLDLRARGWCDFARCVCGDRLPCIGDAGAP